MEQVMLGYDGSVAAESALEWAGDRASCGGIALEVVLVTNMFLSDAREAEHLLSVAKRRWETLAPHTPIEMSRLDGLMPATMSDAARGADLLVLGVHPGSRIRSMLNGWLPLRISSHSRIPTVLVPSGWTAGDEPVTVGIDDDGSSAQALAFAAREAILRRVSLRILHSWLMGTPDPRGRTAIRYSPREVAVEHHRILDQAVDDVRRMHPDLVIVPELVRDNPTSALTAAAGHSSLIVIGTHGRGVFAGGLLGSVGMDLIGSLTRAICVVPDTSAPR